MPHAGAYPEKGLTQAMVKSKISTYKFEDQAIKQIYWVFFRHFVHKRGINLAILVLNRVCFFYSGPELGVFFRGSYFFIIIGKTINKSPSKIMFRVTVSATIVITRVSNFWSDHK